MQGPIDRLLKRVLLAERGSVKMGAGNPNIPPKMPENKKIARKKGAVDDSAPLDTPLYIGPFSRKIGPIDHGVRETDYQKGSDRPNVL